MKVLFSGKKQDKSEWKNNVKFATNIIEQSPENLSSKVYQKRNIKTENTSKVIIFFLKRLAPKSHASSCFFFAFYFYLYLHLHPVSPNFFAFYCEKQVSLFVVVWLPAPRRIFSFFQREVVRPARAIQSVIDNVRASWYINSIPFPLLLFLSLYLFFLALLMIFSGAGVLLFLYVPSPRVVVVSASCCRLFSHLETCPVWVESSQKICTKKAFSFLPFASMWFLSIIFSTHTHWMTKATILGISW